MAERSLSPLLSLSSYSPSFTLYLIHDRVDQEATASGLGHAPLSI